MNPRVSRMRVFIEWLSLIEGCPVVVKHDGFIQAEFGFDVVHWFPFIHD